MDDEICVVFTPANNIRSVAGGSRSSFDRQVLLFKEAIAAMDRDSSDGSGQSQPKAFWKGFVILDAVKNIRDSREEVKMSTVTGVWKKWIQASWMMEGSGRQRRTSPQMWCQQQESQNPKWSRNRDRIAAILG